MKKLYTHISIVSIMVCMTGCASYAPQNKDLSLVLSKSQQAITRLEEKIAVTGNPELGEACAKLSQKSATLFPLLEKCNDKYALTPEYVSTLQETEKTLSRLVKEYQTISDKEYVLNAIYHDYEAKLQTITNTTNNDATTIIKVIVNSIEEEGFFVFGKLSFEQKRNIKRFRFNQPTQNASQDFVPGYYLFWLEKEGRIGTPELHLIMSTRGEEEKKLVLKTPN